MRLACVTCRDLPDWEVDDRPLHAALRARGVDLHHLPWDADVDWSTLDGALIRTTWDYWDRADDFLAWVLHAGEATLLHNPPDVVAWNLRKTYLRDLEARGVALAPTIWLDAGEVPDLEGVLAGWGVSRAFLKPVVGAAASDTLRFTADDAGLAAARAHLHAVQRPMMLQPYLPSVETAGERSVLVIDGELTHAVRKVPVPGDYRVQDDFGASDHAIPLDGALRDAAASVLAAAADALGLDAPLLYARVDLLEHEGSDVLTELELVEPSLFFRHGPGAAEALAEAWIARLG